MRELGTEPFIAVNTGLGGDESAAEEVEYVNGAATTPMGKRRAENGHAEPYGVKWWGIGNEMYGDWQLGHMPLAEVRQEAQPRGGRDARGGPVHRADRGRAPSATGRKRC